MSNYGLFKDFWAIVFGFLSIFYKKYRKIVDFQKSPEIGIKISYKGLKNPQK